MAGIDFADGFDAPEPVAWGLTAVQLVTVAAGAALAYLGLHSPLPRAVAVPLALIAASTGLSLALIRREGRTLISWAAAAARFWARPRHGLLVVAEAPDPPSSGGKPGPGETARTTLDPADPGHLWSSRPQGGAGGQVECPRRAPLVLLPEPLARPAGWQAEEPALMGRETVPILGVADARRLEAPPRGGGTGAEVETGVTGAPDTGWVAADPQAHPRATRRLTFFSLSGGSGRTTLAVEVAGLLAGQAHRGTAWGMLVPPRVALVDLDLMSPRAGLRLGVPAPTEWGLADGEPVGSEVERLQAVHRSGLVVLPGPARLLAPGCCDRADVVRRMGAAVDELERRGCDTIILDVAGDLSALTRWALLSAHDVFVVLTPTAGGVHDAYRSTEALRRLGLRRRLRYVVNRATGGAAALSEAMLDLGGALVAEIPDDPELARAEMDHRLVGLERSGPTAAALRTLAATVDARFLTSAGGAPAPAARRLLRRRAG
ncbi:MAG: ParA family protein [Candidatus Dormibacteria bacterium]